MASLRNAAPRREHRERSQPAARRKLGLLEKHKDYVLRARDYHKKQNTLSTLKKKALDRNPDEFYFGMINSETKKGVHVFRDKEREQKFDHDFLSLLKTQDGGYVRYQRSVNAKKIDRLKANLHFLDTDLPGADEADANDDDEDAALAPPKTQHTIFVDDEESAKTFDPAKHFDTPAEILHRKYNRPRTEALKRVDTAAVDRRTIKKFAKARDKPYRELASRLERDQKLRKSQLELDLQKQLMGKGSKKKIGVDADGVPVYKWKAERKK
ncbi:small-subunit processome [Blyttiomyces helicus]|uniref:U3 small nucleolar RNA-associated protein 11 n=1 Tax=Blyttiomyces helicus TaxID=388810 RepID=A0A4P9WFU3_9FUNG|nr:small-subunit processome [Blyttiomyces helicus]|eukprot:RKO91661.1 small-subunit processome [Blyttiomyces helicus]